jgi:hypothetical protein
MVAHTYNLSYSGGKDQEDSDLRLTMAETKVEDHISTNKTGVVAYFYNPSYVEERFLLCRRKSF